MKISRWLRQGLTVCCAAMFGADVTAAVHLHVAPKGSDRNPGTESRPFQTLERARDEIRVRRKGVGVSAGGFEVVIHSGTYPVRQSFQLNAEDWDRRRNLSFTGRSVRNLLGSLEPCRCHGSGSRPTRQCWQGFRKKRAARCARSC